ncbi:MAG TPA: HepT-like ribonuclease domain-containing protein [Anaerolineales bacterium]|nr:HepT-like ribonuclease domain-containing protein [Anaerolineales bacterium]
MKDDRLYLIHIQEAIERIEEYTREGQEYFLEDHKTQDAVLRNLHTLAESSQRISPGLKERHPQVDWRVISAFRNVVVHDYLGISLNRV